MNRVATPVVSVVIPVFNRPVAVHRAIESVLAQTFHDFEIVVVDDGSTDETAASLATLTDRRIKVIRHERTRGGSAARNTGIGASAAPYVAFLDSDDEWLPTKLERHLDLFGRSTERLALVYTGAERVYGHVTVPMNTTWRQPRDLVKALLTNNVIGETSLGMVRRSALMVVGGFDEDLPSCQDLDLWLRLCERFDAAYVPEALVRVMKNDDSVRISSNVSRTLLGREMYCSKHREKMARHGVLHLHLRDSGWWHQRRVGDPRKARALYVESLEANPLAPFTYLLLLATYVPMPWLVWIARRKHMLSGSWRFRRDAGVEAGRDKAQTAAPFPTNAPNDSATS